MKTTEAWPWQWTELKAEIIKNGFIPCPVCYGTKQNVITGRKVCEDCGGRKKKEKFIRGVRSGVFIPCNRCDEDGTHYYAKWITCEYCKGTGYRTWVDKILRPVSAQYVEEKEY